MLVVHPPRSSMSPDGNGATRRVGVQQLSSRARAPLEIGVSCEDVSTRSKAGRDF